jgi:hypothetical protein
VVRQGDGGTASTVSGGQGQKDGEEGKEDEERERRRRMGTKRRMRISPKKIVGSRPELEGDMSLMTSVGSHDRGVSKYISKRGILTIKYSLSFFRKKPITVMLRGFKISYIYLNSHADKLLGSERGSTISSPWVSLYEGMIGVGRW